MAKTFLANNSDFSHALAPEAPRGSKNLLRNQFTAQESCTFGSD